MRIVIADPTRSGDGLLRCLLGAVYELDAIPAASAPKPADPTALAQWLQADGFRDGTILQLPAVYSDELADAVAAISAHLLAIIRDPYDVFVAAYRLAQRRSDAGDRREHAGGGRSRIMRGKPIDHPDVLGYAAHELRTTLCRADDWLRSGRSEVIRYEDLRRDPIGALQAVTSRMAPVAPARIEEAVAACSLDGGASSERRAGKRAGRRAGKPEVVVPDDVDSLLGPAHLAVFRERHADLIADLGYEVRTGNAEATAAASGEAAEFEGSADAAAAPIPPAERRQFRYARSGGGDFFVKIGEGVVGRFVEYCGLRPDERVLDVGSGVGRIALALTKYLNADARYEGFDVDPEGISWSQENITPQFPNFRFQLADIYTKNYNPEGKYLASEYRFPFDDGSFSFVFLTSIFTHLLPPDLENYLRQIARVLEPGGRCYITMFLLNDASRDDISHSRGSRDFRYDKGGYRLQNEEIPERAIAYDEGYVRRVFAESGLAIAEPVRYRGWSRTKQPTQENQDVIVAVR